METTFSTPTILFLIICVLLILIFLRLNYFVSWMTKKNRIYEITPDRDSLKIVLEQMTRKNNEFLKNDEFKDVFYDFVISEAEIMQRIEEVIDEQEEIIEDKPKKSKIGEKLRNFISKNMIIRLYTSRGKRWQLPVCQTVFYQSIFGLTCNRTH